MYWHFWFEANNANDLFPFLFATPCLRRIYRYAMQKEGVHGTWRKEGRGLSHLEAEREEEEEKRRAELVWGDRTWVWGRGGDKAVEWVYGEEITLVYRTLPFENCAKNISERISRKKVFQLNCVRIIIVGKLPISPLPHTFFSFMKAKRWGPIEAALASCPADTRIYALGKA